MTNEKLEKAQELSDRIKGQEKTIRLIDTMLSRWYDRSDTDITINFKCGQHCPEQRIYHTTVPELRDALKKARDRIKYEQRKTEEEFAAL